MLIKEFRSKKTDTLIVESNQIQPLSQHFSWLKWMVALGAILIWLLLMANIYLYFLANQDSNLELTSLTSFQTNSMPSPTPDLTIKILFGGDVMFDRHIRTKMNQNPMLNPLSELAELASQHDLTIANLEGPITDNPSVSVGTIPGESKNYIFTFPPQTAQLLNDSGFNTVSLANNHICNMGLAGVIDTRQYLDQVGVNYFGHTCEVNQITARYLIKEIKGKKIAFISFNQFITSGRQEVLADLDEIQSVADYIIVIAHWDNEYQKVASPSTVNFAHQLIDRGADLIIGSHPHVVQNKEVYQGKTIYYSLGNLVFDQYFSPEVQKGLLVSVTISDQLQPTFVEYPTQISPDGATYLLN